MKQIDFAYRRLLATTTAVLWAAACANPTAALDLAGADGAAAGGAGKPEAAAEAPSDAFGRRAAEVIRLFNGEIEPDRMFTPGFLAQVPPERLMLVAEGAREKCGRALKADRIERRTAREGSIFVTCEKARLEMKLSVKAEAPHLISGLLISRAQGRAGR